MKGLRIMLGIALLSCALWQWSGYQLRENDELTDLPEIPVSLGRLYFEVPSGFRRRLEPDDFAGLKGILLATGGNAADRISAVMLTHDGNTGVRTVLKKLVEFESAQSWLFSASFSIAVANSSSTVCAAGTRTAAGRSDMDESPKHSGVLYCVANYAAAIVIFRGATAKDTSAQVQTRLEQYRAAFKSAQITWGTRQSA